MDEERINQICKCENCGYETLKHFELCEKCGSESYHEVIIDGI